MSTLLVDLGAAPYAGVSGAFSASSVLAQDPAPPPGEGPEFGKASPTALVVIILLGIATVFLIRSMTKHLRRVPASFDDPAPAGPAREPADGAGPADGSRPAPPPARVDTDPPPGKDG